MIILNSKKVIFIKSHRVGSTSIENALSTLCKSEDIYIPHVVGRIEMKGQLDGHSTAKQIREFVGESAWNNYTKISFVRDPWDQAVSMWKHQCKIFNSPDRPFKNYVAGVYSNALNDWTQVSSDNESVDINFVGKYENFDQDCQTMFNLIGVDPIEIKHLNGDFDSADRPQYHTYYTPDLQNIVAERNAKLISAFGYTFKGP